MSNRILSNGFKGVFVGHQSSGNERKPARGFSVWWLLLRDFSVISWKHGKTANFIHVPK